MWNFPKAGEAHASTNSAVNLFSFLSAPKSAAEVSSSATQSSSKVSGNLFVSDAPIPKAPKSLFGPLQATSTSSLFPPNMQSSSSAIFSSSLRDLRVSRSSNMAAGDGGTTLTTQAPASTFSFLSPKSQLATAPSSSLFAFSNNTTTPVAPGTPPRTNQGNRCSLFSPEPPPPIIRESKQTVLSSDVLSDPAAPVSSTELSSPAMASVKLDQVPQECNMNTFLTEHFSKFGKVRKVVCSKKRHSAVVHFHNSNVALAAKKHGTVLLPHKPPVTITMHKYKSTVKKPVSSLKDRLSSSVKTSTKTTGTAATALSVDVAGQRLRTTAAATNAGQRLAQLEQRDRAYRETLANSSGGARLGRTLSKVHLKGTCTDMCPEKERYMRQEQNRISIYEVSAKDPQCIDHRLAVKEYSRSSADQDEPLSYELRTPEALQRTMLYLLAAVADLVSTDPHSPKPVRWGSWYEFLWSRTRAIRKEITQQRPPEHISVELIEKIARFHIYAAYRLCEEPLDVFEPKINSENLNKCLQSLRELYADAAKHGLPCPNEAEFRAYMILTKLKDTSLLSEVNQLSPQIRNDPRVQQVIETYYAIYHNNYVRFFKLVEHTTFLNACLMHRHFSEVRSVALRTMMHAYSTGKSEAQLNLTFLERQLRFVNSEEAKTFCEHVGHVVIDRNVVFDRNMSAPEFKSFTKRAPHLIESKVVGQSLGGILNNGPLREKEYYVRDPHSSFDADGRLVSSGQVAVRFESSSSSPPVDNHEVDEDELNHSFNASQLSESSVAFREEPEDVLDDNYDEVDYSEFFGEQHEDDVGEDGDVEIVAVPDDEDRMDIIVTSVREEVLHQLIDESTSVLIRTLVTDVIQETQMLHGIGMELLEECCVTMLNEVVQECVQNERHLAAQDVAEILLASVISTQLPILCQDTLRHEHLLQEEVLDYSEDLIQEEISRHMQYVASEQIIHHNFLRRMLRRWHNVSRRHVEARSVLISIPPCSNVRDNMTLCENLPWKVDVSSRGLPLLNKMVCEEEQKETYRPYPLNMFSQHPEPPSECPLPTVRILCLLDTSRMDNAVDTLDPVTSMEVVLKWLLHKLSFYPHDKLLVTRGSSLSHSSSSHDTPHLFVTMVLVGNIDLLPQQHIPDNVILLLFPHLFPYGDDLLSDESDDDSGTVILAGSHPSSHWSIHLEKYLSHWWKLRCQMITTLTPRPQSDTMNSDEGVSVGEMVTGWVTGRYLAPVQQDRKLRDQMDFVDQTPQVLVNAFNACVEHLHQVLLQNGSHPIPESHLQRLRSPPFPQSVSTSDDLSEWNAAQVDWQKFVDEVTSSFVAPTCMTQRQLQSLWTQAETSFQQICLWQEGFSSPALMDVKDGTRVRKQARPHLLPRYVNAPWVDLVTRVLMDRTQQWAKTEQAKMMCNSEQWEELCRVDPWQVTLPYAVPGQTATYRESVTVVSMQQRDRYCKKAVADQIAAQASPPVDFDSVFRDTKRKLAQLKRNLRELSHSLDPK